MLLISVSICIVIVCFIVLTIIKNHRRLFPADLFNIWIAKYDKLLGLIISVLLVVITLYYAITTHMMLKQSDKQFHLSQKSISQTEVQLKLNQIALAQAGKQIKLNQIALDQSNQQFRLSQNPIIGIKLVDYISIPSIDSDYFNAYPIIHFVLEISNLGNAAAIDVETCIEVVTTYKNGKRVVKKPDLRNIFHRQPENNIQFPYLKINQQDTIEVNLDKEDFLDLIGMSNVPDTIKIKWDYIEKYRHEATTSYLEINCLYLNTLGQYYCSNTVLNFLFLDYMNYLTLNRTSNTRVVVKQITELEYNKLVKELMR